MGFDQICFFKTYQSLKSSITGARIEKIYSAKKALILKMYNQKNFSVIFSFNPPFFSLITDYKKERNNFATAIKSHIEQTTITDIKVANDRVIEFNISGKNHLYQKVNYQLYYLIIGRQANLLLCQDNKIIIAQNNIIAATTFNKGDLFSFQPQEPEINNIIDNGENLSNIVKKCIQLYLPEKVKKLLLAADRYYVNKQNDFHLLPFPEATKIDENNLADYFFQERNEQNSDLLALINKKLKRLLAKKEALEIEEKNINNNIIFKDIGKAIYQSGLDLSKYYPIIMGDQQEYQLDPSKSLKENATIAFNKYNKYKVGKEKLKFFYQQNSDEISKLQDLVWQVQTSERSYAINLLNENGFKIKKKKKEEIKPFIIYQLEKTLIKVGKNKKENNQLTFKLSNKDDYFFHVSNYSGAHVIASGVIDSRIIQLAAEIAAFYSTWRHEKIVSVNYCPINQVKKGYQVGEVFLLNFQTISVAPNQHLSLKKKNGN